MKKLEIKLTVTGIAIYFIGFAITIANLFNLYGKASRVCSGKNCGVSVSGNHVLVIVGNATEAVGIVVTGTGAGMGLVKYLRRKK